MGFNGIPEGLKPKGGPPSKWVSFVSFSSPQAALILHGLLNLAQPSLVILLGCGNAPLSIPPRAKQRLRAAHTLASFVRGHFSNNMEGVGVPVGHPGRTIARSAYPC
jgi:hypothetical protein